MASLESLFNKRPEKPSSRIYKSRFDKNREKEELRVMVIDSQGHSAQYLMTRLEIVEVCREAGRKLPSVPFGEMKTKDLRSLDLSLSFTSEPKLVVRTLCCLLSLDPIYAFIMPDKVMLIVPAGADGILNEIRNNLQKVLTVERAEEVAENDEGAVGDPGNSNVEDMAIKGHSEARQSIDSGETSTVATKDNGTVIAETVQVPLPAEAERRGSSETSFAKSHPKYGGKPHHPFGVMRSPRLVAQGSKRHHAPLPQDVGDDMPFQFAALEVLLDTSAAQIKKDVEMLKYERVSVKDILGANRLHAMISSLKAKIVAMRDVVEDFSEDEKEMGLLSFDSVNHYYAKGNLDAAEEESWIPDEMDINEAEDLMEDFISRVDGALYDVDVLKFAVEEIISNLNNAFEERRTSLMLLHIHVQLITATAACGALVASIFGMNLYSGIEESEGTFWVVFGIIVGSFIGASAFFLFFLRKSRVAPSAVVTHGKVDHNDYGDDPI